MTSSRSVLSQAGGSPSRPDESVLPETLALAQARAMAAGESRLLPTLAHVKALVSLIDSLIAANEEQATVIVQLAESGIAGYDRETSTDRL